LSVIEVLCIESFLAHGHEFHLYAYETIANVPEGVKIFDANEILEHSDSYEIKKGFGAKSKAPFADIFRLHLLYKKGGWWVDMDVICLKNFNELPSEVIASSLEIPEGDCGNINVLCFPPGHPFIKSCLERWQRVHEQELHFALGVTSRRTKWSIPISFR
jgi:mannosyltransferase OCH1-like enzyme